MTLTRTIRLKLDYPTKEFIPSFEAYTSAFNQISKEAWKTKESNKYEIQKQHYRTLRSLLPAQLCISVIAKVSEAIKSVKALGSNTCPQSKLCSIRLDHNSYNVWFDRNQLSILTTEGRKKFDIKVPEYFKQYLNWRRKSAELFLRGNSVFISIVFEKDVEDPVKTDQVLGVDRGIRQVAVTSDNRFFGGGKVRRISERYKKLRAALQAKKTKSAKRHLRKISKKENRFRRDTNHCISKQIVSKLDKGTTIVLEDLTNIRDNSKPFRKEQRAEKNSWSFFQLEMFLRYKAESKGCFVDYVDARYTSQKCSKCGHIDKANRKSQSSFVCQVCGFSLHADLNASRNIRNNFQDAIRYPDWAKSKAYRRYSPKGKLLQATML